ncbi:hypothetical protein HON22_03050 [Candidatus Peregrinibacteria bacterium]|jgi:hypothetical protein|nr:hypothetical protein [Candidatus Peregrinibacteria bacterium]
MAKEYETPNTPYASMEGRVSISKCLEIVDISNELKISKKKLIESSNDTIHPVLK